MPEQTATQHIDSTLADKTVWFTKLIETADEGVAIIDPQGRFTYVNPRLAEMVGYQPEEFIGRPFFEFMAPEAREEALEHLERRQRGLRENYEVQLLRKDGSTIWVQNRTNPLLDENGQMAASLCMVVDISARRQWEKQLRSSEEMNRQIIDAVPGGIIWVGMDGSILRTNAEAERILKLRFNPQSKVFISDFENLTVWEDGTECVLADYPVTRCLRTGQPQPPMTIGWLRPDGGLAWCICSAIPHRDPQTGARTGAVVTFLDITARKRAEEALRENEERFRLAVENSPDSTFYQDVDFRFTWMSRTAPLAMDAVIGHTDEDLVGKEEAERLAEVKRRVLATGVSERIDATFRHGDRLHSFDVALVRRTDKDGRVLGLAGYARDVTERIEAEQALKALNETLEQRVAERTESLHKQTQILQSVLNSMSDIVVVADEKGNMLMHNPAYDRHTGPRPTNLPPTFEAWSQTAAVYKSDKVTACPLEELPLARALRGEAVNDEQLLIRRPNRPDTWLSVSAVPLLDEQGRPGGGVAVCRDYTERKQAEEQLREREQHYRELSERNRLLIQEVEHRVGNNLAGLLGLVEVMRNRTRDVDAFADAIESRLRAMAEVQRMLLASRWKPLDLRSLVDSVLRQMGRMGPHGTEYQIEGTQEMVAPERVLPLMLILVEWFTNSCKYGVHSKPNGRLLVTYGAGENEGHRVVTLRWIERDGPAPQAHITPSLGTELVHLLAKRELRGDCRMTFPPTGAVHTLVFQPSVATGQDGAASPHT